MSAVAGGTSTLSKYASQFPETFPRALVRAQGSQVWADDGRQFTDWISGGLAVLLGHNHPEVTEAVTKHLRDGGPTWSLPHPLEEAVAETILRLTGFEGGKVRFLKSGSEANSAAVRIVRAVTGRDRITDLGTYHGWHDQFQHASPAWGVPDGARKDVDTSNLGGALHTSRIDDAAAVIAEPDGMVPVRQRPFLHLLWGECQRRGALLIFDECKTGGRYPEFTAARHLGVQPDLLVLSKCLANGWPLACVVGTADAMACLEPDWRERGPVYISGTYSSETASLAAAQATLRVWERDCVAEHLAEAGEILCSMLRVEARHGVTIGGLFYRLLLEAPSAEVKTAVMAFLAEQGHLIGPGWNVTAAHTPEEVHAVVAAFRGAMVAIDGGYTGGRPVAPLYR